MPIHHRLKHKIFHGKVTAEDSGFLAWIREGVHHLEAQAFNVHAACAYCGRTKRELEEEWAAVYERHGNFSPKMTRDHVVPLGKGGENKKGNVVPACAFCNSAKSNTSVVLFMMRREEVEAARRTKHAQLSYQVARLRAAVERKRGEPKLVVSTPSWIEQLQLDEARRPKVVRRTKFRRKPKAQLREELRERVERMMVATVPGYVPASAAGPAAPAEPMLPAADVGSPASGSPSPRSTCPDPALPEADVAEAEVPSAVVRLLLTQGWAVGLD